MRDSRFPFQQERLLHHFSSITIGPDDMLVAAALGSGVYRIFKEGHMACMDNGLPEGTIVNRLQQDRDVLYACTNKGLFHLEGDSWQADEVTVPCYQLKSEGGYCFAATQYGIWCKSSKGWLKTDIYNQEVYDFIQSPDFLFLGSECGLSIYDWYTSSWIHYPMGSPITSMASLQGRLVGTTGQGELVFGNAKGAFDKVVFERFFFYSVIASGGKVYACSNRGLFLLTCFRDNLRLISIKQGIPVTDVAFGGSTFYLATLYDGIQTIALKKEEGGAV
ncbi:hypothetical protein [Paenibacillus thalictri]|uniref:WD40 repeat domain-containing protein n=1 Tax=Paenibacillus thalictri TaxID=2527873 RepID=A0A4Q9DGL5_9BACL|nr:hypothetical protein [Paenibacillus thalictri]TBL71379.1 hypothetical protein EYB31_30270 [Paenibacillus thalictri]